MNDERIVALLEKINDNLEQSNGVEADLLRVMKRVNSKLDDIERKVSNIERNI